MSKPFVLIGLYWKRKPTRTQLNTVTLKTGVRVTFEEKLEDKSIGKCYIVCIHTINDIAVKRVTEIFKKMGKLYGL
jgi:hypothetical protein